MKRTKLQAKLKWQLELVRTTIRTLTPTELGQVNGANATFTCPSKCYYTVCVDE